MAAVSQSVLQSAKRLSGLGRLVLTRACRQISPLIFKKVTATSTFICNRSCKKKNNIWKKEKLKWAIPFNIRTPPIEVLYISPPWKSKLLTPQEKKIKVPTHSPFRIYSEIKDADTQKTPPPLPLGFPLTSIGGVHVLNGMAQ